MLNRRQQIGHRVKSGLVLARKHPAEVVLIVALFWPGLVFLRAHWRAAGATAGHAVVDLASEAETQFAFRTRSKGAYRIVLYVDRGDDPPAEAVLGHWYPRTRGRLAIDWSIKDREDLIIYHEDAPGKGAGFVRSATRLGRILDSFEADAATEYVVGLRIRRGDASWNGLNPTVEIVDHAAGEEVTVAKAKALALAAAILLAYGLWKFVRLVWERLSSRTLGKPDG